MEKQENEKLKWRFDISTFRLIGRELITDRITALFELLKNSYDANSTRVDIIFENVTYKDNDENLIGSKITIRDNGYGMSFSDIRDKWMVIGTANKRKNPISPDPFNRRCVGEKGIGRFAVDKLGNKVEITTKKNLDNRWLKVEIDWDNYSTPREDNDITLFTDIENQYSYINTENSTESGTLLEISDIRENWSAGDIKRFRDEANKIVSPYYTSNPPFEIYISAPEFKIFTEKVERKTVDFATIQQEITFDKLKNKQEIIKFNEDSGEFYKETIPIKSFGGISLKLYFFDEFARKKYHNAFSDRIDGIKIYRDGIITTPFAESEYSQDKKRDILGIDKRLWQDMFSRVSTREIIGNLDISKIENPLIIDSTNRQDFLDNTQYRELKDFIIEQLYAFQQYKIFVRSKKKKNINDELKEATQNVDLFTSVVNQVVQSNPELRIELQPLIDQARKTSSTVKKAIKEHKDAEKEFLRKESLYLSIMSLQEYAIQIAHAVRTSLGKVESKAKFFYDYYPDPDEAEYFKLYSKEIYHEMKVLDNVINFMLSYSRSNLSFDNIHISRLVSGLFENYKTTFNSEKITLILDIRDNLQINSNEQFFFDIFQNLISNSIKALKNNTTKLIKCSLYSENNNLIIIFSDNGYGIPFDKREWVFGLYNTTTEDTGGAGVGLFIVKTRIESLNGTIKIIDSEYGNQGVSFKIELPFKK